jgi:hypothetical protein
MCEIDLDVDTDAVRITAGEAGMSTNVNAVVFIAPDINTCVVLALRWRGNYGLFHLDAGKFTHVELALKAAFKNPEYTGMWLFGRAVPVQDVLACVRTFLARSVPLWTYEMQHPESGLFRMTVEGINAHDGSECITEEEFFRRQ